MAVAQWLFLADKTGLSLLCAVWWLALPLLYAAFSLLRASGGKPIGHTGLLYPYPFLDLKRLGWGGLLRNTAVLLVLFFLLGCVLVGLGALIGHSL